MIAEDALPYYFDLAGMDDVSFVADVVFTYDEADVISRRLVEENLTLVRSLKAGLSWSEIDTTLDTQANTLTVEGLTTLGWFAIVDLSDRQPGDMDRDGDSDLHDVAGFLRCYTDLESSQTDPACVGALLDADEHVDLSDYALFHGCMSAPGVPADPACAE